MNSTESSTAYEHQEGLHGKSRLSRLTRHAVYRVGPLRRAVKSRLGSQVVYTLRVAPLVRNPLGFALGQVRDTGTTELTLRRSGRVVAVRPHSGDLVMLHQILGRDVYAPPGEVLGRLAAVAGPLRIADLGGNVGFFTMRMLERWPDAECLVVEPDPGNAAICRRTFGANRLEGQVELVEAAAATEPGTVSFDAGNFFESRIVEPGGAGTVEVEAIDVLPRLAGRHLVKIDIEGSEWPILADRRFAELDAVALTMEWHAHGCPDDDPAGLAQSTLEAAGFTVLPTFSEDSCGTLWAWR